MALDIDPREVFAVGYSNGAQMAYRLALEVPNEIRAVAAISANLPRHRTLIADQAANPFPSSL